MKLSGVEKEYTVKVRNLGSIGYHVIADYYRRGRRDPELMGWSLVRNQEDPGLLFVHDRYNPVGGNIEGVKWFREDLEKGVLRAVCL
jgi:hypothetical protein